MQEMIFRIESRRRKYALMVGNASAGITLLLAGLDNLDTDSTERLIVGIIMIIAGGALLGIVLKERFGKSHQTPAAVGWADIFAGIVFMVDGVEKMMVRVRPLPFILIFLGVPYILMGIYHERISARSFLRIDDTGIRMRLARFRDFTINWADITAIHIIPSTIMLTGADGRLYKIHLYNLPREDDQKAVLEIFVNRARGLNTGETKPPIGGNDSETSA